MSSQQALYTSPIADSKNVLFVENRIVVDKPHTVVFDWVTNWANLNKWLPVAHSTKVLNGQENAPSQLGDVLWEDVKANIDHLSPVPIPKYYTVVAHVPGFLWSVAGEDGVRDSSGNEKGDGKIKWVAVFTTFPLEDGKTLYCREFQQIRDADDKGDGRKKVLDSATIQKGLERLKAAVEAL